MQRTLPVSGATVWIRQRPWIVERCQRSGPCVEVRVRDRHGPITFLTPFDRVESSGTRRRPRRVTLRHARARLAHLAVHRQAYVALPVTASAAIDICPHQLEPVLAVLDGKRRVLVADEVGLGKTIEAGLVLAELEHRHGGLRAMVICPASLRAQWADELTRRFGLDCHTGDANALLAASRDLPHGRSPWLRQGIWITSPEFLKQRHVLEGIPFGPWDVVVIDEAHEAAGSTERHAACHELARRARRVLLLTATPHSGDIGRFNRLLRLGELAPDDALTVFRRGRADVAGERSRRVRWHLVSRSPVESVLLAALRHYEQAVLEAAGSERTSSAWLLLSVFRKRALSTAFALRLSLTRRLEWLDARSRGTELEWLQPVLFDDGDPSADESHAGLTEDVGLPAGDERPWLIRLLNLARQAESADSKLARIAALLGRTTEPVIVFTEFRDSAESLRRRLQTVRSTAVLHGGLAAGERAQALRQFDTGTCSALVATDIAGQGLNLQGRARWVVNLELPWNPVRLEQRIGRVDRIGQRRPVHATMLVADHPTEAALLAQVARRALLAQQVLGARTFVAVTPPTELAVAGQIIAGTGPGVPAGTPCTVALCTAYKRRSAALSRLLARERRGTESWRHPRIPDRPVVVRLRQSGGPLSKLALGTAPDGRAQPLLRRHLAVLSVPILDGAGHLLERHLIVVTLPADAVAHGVGVRVLALIAASRLKGRVRRLRRLVDAAQLAERRIDTWLARALQEHATRASGQIELFSRPTDRGAVEAREHAIRLLTSADARMAHAEVRCGVPALEILIEQPSR